MSTAPQSRHTHSLLIISAFVLQIVFFAPLRALAENFGEFSVRFGDVLMVQLAISSALVVLIYLLVRLFRLPLLLAILTFLSSMAFLESRFFLAFARHEPFNGQAIDWAALQGLSYVELGVVIILACVFVLVRKRTQLLYAISLFILVFLTLGFVYENATRLEILFPGPLPSRADVVYFDQFHQLSSRRNVIHIVPDQTQGALLEDILSSDYEHYSSVFDGFTLFTQAVGRYKGTYPNVVYFMAGEAPQPAHDRVRKLPFTWQYIEEVLTERSILTLLAQQSFKLFGFQFHPGIFCKGPYTACIGTHDEVFAGVAVNSPERRFALTILTAIDLGLFQMTPIALRQHIYDSGRWFTRKLATDVRTHSGILDIFTQQIEVTDIPGTYNYFHHAGAHAPILFDRDCNHIGPQEVDLPHQREQVMCTLEQLAEMIQALKQAGVYDQTMIVVNGDHGTPGLPPAFEANTGKRVTTTEMGMASTLVLIKPPDTRGPLLFSGRPVTTGDIPATIANALSLEHAFPGEQMFAEEPIVGREREYYSYDSASKAHKLEALPNLIRYRIQGDVFDENDWLPPNAEAVGQSLTDQGKNPSQLRMNHPEFASYADGFSHLEQHDVPVRWVDGTLARVLLSPPSKGPMMLVFNSFIPSFISGQSMKISIGEKLIAELDAKELAGNQHIVPIPDNLPRTDVLEIHFKMAKAASTGQDSRHLSVLFSYIGLEPTD